MPLLSLFSTLAHHFVALQVIGIVLAATLGSVHAQFEMPVEPCTESSVQARNFVTGPENNGNFSITVLGGARMGNLGGAGNSLGNDQILTVNSLIFGYNGNMSHSNSVLFSYGLDAAGSQSHRPYEFRARFDNGAVFEHTSLRASALLTRDQDSSRENVTTLASYLVSQDTNATTLLSTLPTYRYRWSETYSPETRFRYGFRPFEVVSVDPSIGVVDQNVVIQLDSPAIVNDTKAGICQLENRPPDGTFTSNDIDHGAIDVGSLVTMLVESIKELNARVTALEQP